METKNKFYRLSANKQKIILLLLAGVTLGFARTPGQFYKVVKGVGDEWKRISDRTLKRNIASLYQSKLVSKKKNKDGSVSIVLTDQGKEKALTFNMVNIKIKKPKTWDKNWRLVLFDVPEKLKKSRNALRNALKRLEFYEFQKSVFVHPYECQDELDYIIEIFKLRPYVRTALTVHFDNELDLKNIFELP